MTLLEADEIFKVWKLWFYPTHNYLFSIFMSHIPESFLPYPKDTLLKALEIIVKMFQESGEKELSEALHITMSYLCFYVDDQQAYEMLVKKISQPELVKTASYNAKKFTLEWVEWIKKQK